MSYIPPEFRATVVKVAVNNYACMWLGRTITANVHRSKSRTMANKINAMLRRMQDQTDVYQTSLIDTLNEYLPAAASGTSGFIPPMNLIP